MCGDVRASVCVLGAFKNGFLSGARISLFALVVVKLTDELINKEARKGGPYLSEPNIQRLLRIQHLASVVLIIAPFAGSLSVGGRAAITSITNEVIGNKLLEEIWARTSAILSRPI